MVRSVEDETSNARRNPNRNPEWCGDFSQLQTQNHDLNLCREIQRNSIQSKSQFEFVPRDTGEFEFLDFD